MPRQNVQLQGINEKNTSMGFVVCLESKNHAYSALSKCFLHINVKMDMFLNHIHPGKLSADWYHIE